MIILVYYNLIFLVLVIISIGYENIVLTKVIAKILKHGDIPTKSDRTGNELSDNQIGCI